VAARAPDGAIAPSIRTTYNNANIFLPMIRRPKICSASYMGSRDGRRNPGLTTAVFPGANTTATSASFPDRNGMIARTGLIHGAAKPILRLEHLAGTNRPGHCHFQESLE
jgi:hypothetical protein